MTSKYSVLHNRGVNDTRPDWYQICEQKFLRRENAEIVARCLSETLMADMGGNRNHFHFYLITRFRIREEHFDSLLSHYTVRDIEGKGDF